MKFAFCKKSVLVVVLTVLSVSASAALAPQITSFTADKYQVLPGESVNLSLAASDPDCASTCTTGCGLYIRSDMTTWSSSGGAFTSTSNGTSSSPYAASAVWQAPMTEGSYTVTVTIYDSATSMCGGRKSASGNITILVSSAPPNDPPVIASLTATPASVGPQGTSALSATASDPNGDAITYEWSASSGVVAPGVAGAAQFTAPSQPGAAVITLTVRDAGGLTTQRTVTVTVSLVHHAASAGLQIYSPSKVSLDGQSALYAVDAGAGELLRLALPGFVLEDKIPLQGITSVSALPLGALLVGTLDGAFVRTAGGGLIEMNAPAPLVSVMDVAFDEAGRKYAVLYREGKVALFDEGGGFINAFGEFGDGPGQYKSPTSVFFGPAGDIFLADNGHGLVHRYDAYGVFTSSFGGRGGDPGQFIQLDSIFVDGSGRVWATDSFKSLVQVFSADGTLLDAFGGYGSGSGLMKTPSGVSVDVVGGMAYVASMNSQSIESFALYAAPAPNQPPTAPIPASPQAGASIFIGSPVVLSALNGTDPDGDELFTDFDLYSDNGGTPSLLSKHTIRNSESGETSVDVTADITAVGEYFFRCRTFDGTDYSGYSADRHFSVIDTRPNTPPGPPSPQSPADGSETGSLVPVLTVLNGSDADGDALTYLFELLRWNGETVVPFFTSEPVAAGEVSTSFTVPAGTLEESQQIFFRAYSYDGLDYSEASAQFSFKTPPVPTPSAAELGYMAGGDSTRPGEVRYSIPPGAADTVLYYELYDSSGGEVTMLVNGVELAVLPATAADDWSGSLSVTIPGPMLSAEADNVIAFLHNTPSSQYGVRNVGLFPVSAPALASTSFNTVVDISFSHRVSLEDVTAVRLYRSLDPNDGFSMVAEVDKERKIYRDTGLVNGTVYYYRASYLRSSTGEGAKSLHVTGSPVAGTVTPITDLMLRKSGTDVILEWTPVTNDPPIDSIELYSDGYGDFACDTVNFSNLLTTVDPALSTLTLFGKAKEEGNEWFSLIPFDGVSLRGTP